MGDLAELFENNRAWAADVLARDPGFFAGLAERQSPRYFWIGCSDSRVPANEIVGLAPGEVFVHRNVANVVVHTDLNCLSVLQYAVDVLGVRDVIVCGHYGCGGVRAALDGSRHGLVDNWLRHVMDVGEKHEAELAALGGDGERFDRLCELNVMEQVVNVSQTTIVEDAWARGQELTVHGVDLRARGRAAPRPRCEHAGITTARQQRDSPLRAEPVPVPLGTGTWVRPECVNHGRRMGPDASAASVARSRLSALSSAFPALPRVSRPMAPLTIQRRASRTSGRRRSETSGVLRGER